MDKMIEEAVCKMYRQGMSLRKIGEKLGYTGEGIRVALLRNGVTFADKKQSEIPLNKADSFLGLFVEPDVKKALKEEAIRLDVSVSALTREPLRKMLIEKGYELED